MRKLLQYPLPVFLTILGLTIFFGLQLPQLEINNDMEIFIPEEHPSKQSYRSMQDTFGSQSIVGVGVEFSAGTVFEPERVELISELSSRVEELDYVESVSSLTTSDYIEGTTEGMRATQLLEDFSGTEEEVSKLKSRVLSWREMYRNNLVSDDFTSTQIAVTLEEDTETAEREEFYSDLKNTLSEYRRPDISYYIAGDPVSMVLIKQNITGDLMYLIPLVTIVVILALFLAFRNIGGVLLPIITVLISTVWATGIMSLLGIYFSIISTVIPVILIAVGSAYVIHVFNHYYEAVRTSKGDISRKEHADIVHRTIKEIGPPVIMTALTTAAGFASIATSTIVPMRQFGIINAVGVVSALVVTLTFVPAVLLMRHSSLKRSSTLPSQFSYDDRFNRSLEGFYRYFSRRRLGLVFFSLVIVGISLFGISKIVVNNSMIEYFEYDSEIRRSDRFLRENFSGSKVFSIIVEGEEEGSLTNPVILKRMDDLKRHLIAEHEDIGAVLSFSDFIKRMNKVMNYPEESIIDPSEEKPVFLSVLDGSGGTSTAGTQGSEGSGGSGGSEGSQDSEGTGVSGDTDSFFDSGGSESESGGSETESESGTESGGSEPDSGTEPDSGESWSGGASVEGSFFSDDDDVESEVESGSESESTAEPAEEQEFAEQEGHRAGTQADSSEAFGYGRSISYTKLMETLNRAYYDAESMDMSLHEFMQKVNRQLNFQGEYYNEIPTDPSKYPVETEEELSNLISQYLLVYSGGLDDFADDSLEPQKARMSVQLRSIDTRRMEDIRRDIHSFAKEYFPEGYSVSIAGYADMERAVTDLIVRSQILSLLSAFVVVLLIVAAANRSLIAGLFGLVPLSFAVLINFGIMGIAGVDLNIATAMIASIAIGIGIDYTIHFLSRYRIEWNTTGNADEAARRTVMTTGRAIVFNAVAVAAGFAVLLLSNFNPLRYVGVLVAIIMGTSSLAAMTILPVLLSIFKPKFLNDKNKTTEKEEI
ncbi:MAG: MMPL family transporter [Spirochaetia bacterium]